MWKFFFLKKIHYIITLYTFLSIVSSYTLFIRLLCVIYTYYIIFWVYFHIHIISPFIQYIHTLYIYTFINYLYMLFLYNLYFPLFTFHISTSCSQGQKGKMKLNSKPSSFIFIEKLIFDFQILVKYTTAMVEINSAN